MRYDPQSLAALEPNQFAAAKQAPLPRRQLGRGVVALLALLRVYVLIGMVIVAYAFVHALTATPS
jgi:hypothetical protein